MLEEKNVETCEYIIYLKKRDLLFPEISSKPLMIIKCIYLVMFPECMQPIHPFLYEPSIKTVNEVSQFE